jgi:segregation and condensation protein A
MTFVVTTPAFSGPVQKLLELISGHDIDILDVEIAPLVDSFVAVVHNESTHVSMDELSEFLLIAAILLEMKSGRLLPRPEIGEPDEEFVGWEERDVLLARLLELRTYGSLAHVFVNLFDRAQRSHPRLAGFNVDFTVTAPDLLLGVTPDMLAMAFLKGIEEKPVPLVTLHHVTVDSVTVTETVLSLAGQLPAMGKVSFRALIAHATTRIEVIVHFLALLELCKLGHVALGQGITFGDVEVEWISERSDIEIEMVDVYEG